MGITLIKPNGYTEKQLGTRLEHRIETTLYRALHARCMDTTFNIQQGAVTAFEEWGACRVKAHHTRATTLITVEN